MTAIRPELRSQIENLRRSHCDTCGCARCRQLETLLEGAIDPPPQPAFGRHLRGQLTNSDRRWVLQTEMGATSLEEVLGSASGHEVILLLA